MPRSVRLRVGGGSQRLVRSAPSLRGLVLRMVPLHARADKQLGQRPQRPRHAVQIVRWPLRQRRFRPTPTGGRVGVRVVQMRARRDPHPDEGAARRRHSLRGVWLGPQPRPHGSRVRATSDPRLALRVVSVHALADEPAIQRPRRRQDAVRIVRRPLRQRSSRTRRTPRSLEMRVVRLHVRADAPDDDGT